MKTSKAQKAADKRIEAAYRVGCQGVHVDIMDIRKVFDVGRRCIEAGADEATLRKSIRDYVELIRKN